MKTEQREQTVDEVLDEMKSAARTLSLDTQSFLQESERSALGAVSAARMVEVVEHVRALVNTVARGIIVNRTIREYIAGTIAEALRTDTEPNGYSEIERARILTLATYLNSLK